MPGLNGIKCGNAINDTPSNALKSTFPSIIAKIYPTISPNKTDNCLK